MLGATIVALASAVCFAAASVAQHRGAQHAPTATAMNPGLLLRLARSPLWLAGTLGDAAGSALQIVALGFGAVVFVQPLLVSSLLIAVPLSAAVDRRRMVGGEWVGAVLCFGGLLAFVLASHASVGRKEAPLLEGLPLLLATGTAVVALVLGARHRHRAIGLAAAAGLSFGVSAALLRLVTVRLDDVPGLLASWPLYGVILVGGAGYLLSQNAFQAGSLPAPLAVMTILDPVVGVVVGLALLDERLSTSSADLVAMCLGAVAVVVGVVLLAHSTPGGGPPHDRRAADRRSAQPAVRANAMSTSVPTVAP